MSAGQQRYHMNGHELRVSKEQQAIYFNQPYRNGEVLRIDPQEVGARNGEFEIWFYFGGEKSPLLLSRYTLKIDFTNLEPRDLNSFFTKIDENRYSFEHSDELGITEDERIKQLIGR
jgi:hypothetical protein